MSAPLPLAGRSVVVTRPRAQAGPLLALLAELGASTVEVPAIEIGEPADGGAALRAAAAAAADGAYDLVVFTSANGVERFFAVAPGPLAGTRVAAIGPGTADALAQRGVVADLVPQRFVAESLLDAIGPPPASDRPSGAAAGAGRGRRVLLARAAVARDVLPEGLRAAGWEVDVVEAYRTGTGAVPAEVLDRAAAADAVCFTSSSTVTGYLDLMGGRRVASQVVCIGPITAATAREHGLPVAAEAPVHTIDGLVAALVELFNEDPS